MNMSKGIRYGKILEGNVMGDNNFFIR